MKRFLILGCILLCATLSGAQSDCQATWCGSVPVMGVYDAPGWETDMFIGLEGEGHFFFRLRSIPMSPFTPSKFIEVHLNGKRTMGAYDLVSMLWGDIEFDGVVLLDWGSNDGPLTIEVLPLLRKNKTFAGQSLSYLMERGCHTIPAPWSGGSTSGSFEVYNPSEFSAQTFQVDAFDIEVLPPSPLDDLNFVIVEVPYSGPFIEICIGIDPHGSVAGLDLDQPVWVLPRFIHAGDRVTTRVW